AASARTAVIVRSGATSRLASLTHAAVLLLIVFVAAPLVSQVPRAVLAGVLLATAVRMVEVGAVRAMARASRPDAVVLALTAVATLALDLVTAVIVGLLLAGVFALRAVSRSARLSEVPLEPGDHGEEERALLAQHIVAYRLDGPLLFHAAHRFLLELSEVSPMAVVVLRMSHLSGVDTTGVAVLRDAVRRLEGRGVTVLVSGVREEHRRALDAVGAPVFDSTPEAIEHARALLGERGLLPT
ncbi:SulP family inorganic anion transporter, partial [Actinosynnema sp.]|uniref:SulP family inorganic anion transporter n=1 Tax=Actinosynnema sp. TaxID=1872144 RepID=UPI003F8611CC